MSTVKDTLGGGVFDEADYEHNLTNYIARLEGNSMRANEIYALVPTSHEKFRTIGCEHCRKILEQAVDKEAPFLLLLYGVSYVPDIQCYVTLEDIVLLMKTNEHVSFGRIFSDMKETYKAVESYIATFGK